MYGGIGYNDTSTNNPTNYQFNDSTINKIRNYKDDYTDDNIAKSHTFGGYDCTKVYPEYLAYLDAKEYLKNDENGPKNLHRCEWSKKCGVPWTEAGCE
jgi:hypothetical protein